MPLKIGTRGSKLALVQTERVARLLAGRGIEVEMVIVRTQGDAVDGVPLHEIGGQGVFVRALDDAILNGEIDAAVHSYKDIPAERPKGVITAAILERDSPADFLAFDGDISGVHLVGTSSTRRRAQLLRHDPTIRVRQLRGNVDTRLRKLAHGDFDAIVLAEAGIQRLGYQVHGCRLPPERFVPSANQGTIAVVARDEENLLARLRPIDDAATRVDTAFERALMEEVGAGCFTPMGVYCKDGHIIAEVLALEGSRTERIEANVSLVEDARAAGRRLREKAADLIADAYARLGIEHGG